LKAGFHVDHKIALANGGTNDRSNIELLCPPCNLRKHAKDPIVWARENGRLL
jgi:5-methylcytosine-specific restriction endonuclease McrA